MKRFLKILIQACLIALLGVGLFKSYSLYQQNLLGKKNSYYDAIPKNRSFVILVFQKEGSSQKNLFSLLSQRYDNYQILYFYDQSFDEEKKITSFFDKEEKIHFIKDSSENDLFYKTVYDCHEDDILLIMNSTDFLAHENVLTKLNEIYNNPYTWMTYGSFLYYPCYKQSPVSAKPFSKQIIFNNSYRSQEIFCPTPLTFYVSLFKKIKLDDLKQIQGPLSYAVPLLEMAGKHAKFIPEVLYLKPQEESKLFIEQSLEQLAELKKLPKYKRLKAPLFNYE